MLLKLGSTGPDVGRLAARLTELGLYTSSPNSVFGADIEAAVKAFQQSNGLTPDGAAGDQTWAALFPAAAATAPTPSPLLNAALVHRCLALTGTFETSTGIPDCFAGLAGDFDGQGLSFGAAQWNFGQGTLQPMLAEMVAAHADVMTGLFGAQLDALRTMLASPPAAQLAWVRGIQDSVRHKIFEPWNGLLRALGRTPEFQAIEVGHAGAMYQTALASCAKFGVTTERAAALMFDIRVQNGSIGATAEAKIRADFADIPAVMAPLDMEVARLRSIANRRAEASSAAYVEDVRTRKLTIANGQGTVHGRAYDLEREFGIRLVNMAGDLI